MSLWEKGLETLMRWYQISKACLGGVYDPHTIATTESTPKIKDVLDAFRQLEPSHTLRQKYSLNDLETGYTQLYKCGFGDEDYMPAREHLDAPFRQCQELSD